MSFFINSDVSKTLKTEVISFLQERVVVNDVESQE